MKIKNNIQKIEVFYDGNCGLCGQFKKWLEKAIKPDIELYCVPYASEQAREVFPKIDNYQPSENLVLRADEQDVYCGEQAWVICLYCTRHYRWLARIMRQPRCLLKARKVALCVAKNRYRISKLLLQERATVVDDYLETEQEEVNCQDKQCKF